MRDFRVGADTLSDEGVVAEMDTSGQRPMAGFVDMVEWVRQESLRRCTRKEILRSITCLTKSA